jgi:ankyrin repeat protein
VPARPLPTNPNLENLRNQAKTLHRLVRAGDDEALSLLREFHPDAAGESFRRSDAQLVIARRYGFTSWRRLVEHVEFVNEHTRAPHRSPVVPPGDRADQFLRLVCVTYGGDDLARQARGRELLAAHPDLTSGHIHAAAAAGDVAAARELLDRDPALARHEGGPHAWPPLLYLAFARAGGERRGYSPLGVARLLLDRGADPNSGYLWEGLPSPFTALTGAFGEGEDVANQPRHPESERLARMLLDAGADPNDSQALYNRMFRPANDHLELLFEYGLGRGDGGPWHAVLGAAHQTPAEMVQCQLLWAAERNHVARVRLLLRHGVDVRTPDVRHRGLAGRGAYEIAVLLGNIEIAVLLAEAGPEAAPAGGPALGPEAGPAGGPTAGGEPPAASDPAERLAAACMRGDASTVDRLVATDPGLPVRLIAEAPDLLIRAAELDRPDAVRLLVRVGFDVNGRQRITPLHEAAYNGSAGMARLLIELGADPNVRDAEFDATPAGWAEHSHHDDLAAYLRGVEHPA